MGRDPAPEAVRVAEFGALRAEIDQRISLQQSLLALNLTAVGGVIGFVVSSDRVTTDLLLVIPVVSPMLGLLWLGHESCIRRIAKYIREQGWIWTPSWEEAIERERGESNVLGFVFRVAVALAFVGVAAVALVLARPWNPAASVGVCLLWATGVVTTCLNVVAFTRVDWR